MNTSSFVSFYDPYMYQTLSTIIGATITVQTTHGSLHGQLQQVMPDHLVVSVNQTPFFVRTQQIVWVFANPQ